MALLVTRLVNIGSQLVVVSVTFGAWLQLSPALMSFNGPTYVTVQQRVLRGLKRFMPFVLLTALVSTIADLIQVDDQGTWPFDWTVASAVFFAAFLFITVRHELPINAEIEHWNAETPPPDWAEKRRTWERWQTVRAWLSVLALLCLIAAALSTSS